MSRTKAFHINQDFFLLYQVCWSTYIILHISAPTVSKKNSSIIVIINVLATPFRKYHKFSMTFKTLTFTFTFSFQRQLVFFFDRLDCSCIILVDVKGGGEML